MIYFFTYFFLAFLISFPKPDTDYDCKLNPAFTIQVRKTATKVYSITIKKKHLREVKGAGDCVEHASVEWVAESYGGAQEVFITGILYVWEVVHGHDVELMALELHPIIEDYVGRGQKKEKKRRKVRKNIKKRKRKRRKRRKREKEARGRGI